MLLTRQLVEQDHVLAIFNSVGTDNNLAVRDYLNAAKVPQLFGGTGVAKIGDAYRSDPWTMGYLPSFRAEGAIYGRSIAKLANPKVGVLFENSEFGKDMTAGLKKGLGARPRRSSRRRRMSRPTHRSTRRCRRCMRRARTSSS